MQVSLEKYIEHASLICACLFSYKECNGAFSVAQGCFANGSSIEESDCDAGDMGSIPVSERSPGGGNDNLLQYSCLENPMDIGDWWATVHGVTKVGHNLVTKQQHQ